MADITRIITVEMTKVFRDAKEGCQERYGKRVDTILEEVFGNGFDDIKIAKIQDFVFPDQPKAPKLTKRERAFCELIPDGYIARDGDADLYWYETKPWKADGMWHCIDESITLEVFDEIPFMFIEWEDDEPWAVSSLLELEVQEDE